MKNFLVVELAWTLRRKREKRSLKIMKFRLVFIKELIWLCIKFWESFAPLLLALVTTPLIVLVDWIAPSSLVLYRHDDDDDEDEFTSSFM